MKKEKSYSELYTVDEFISFYSGASRKELKAVLKRLKNKNTISEKNEKLAIITLLM